MSYRSSLLSTPPKLGMTFLEKVIPRIYTLPTTIGMTFQRNVIPHALKCHIQELGMTFPYNVILTPEPPMTLPKKVIHVSFFIFYSHTRIYIHRHCCLIVFSSFWPKNLLVTNYKSKSLLIPIFNPEKNSNCCQFFYKIEAPSRFSGMLFHDSMAVSWFFWAISTAIDRFLPICVEF